MKSFAIPLIILLMSFKVPTPASLKSCSSSDFDTVDAALNRHGWADGEDKEKRGWRVKGGRENDKE